MSYYQFNRQEVLQKAKKYSKEKAAEYSLQNKKALKEKARYRNLREEEKNKIKEHQKRSIKN